MAEEIQRLSNDEFPPLLREIPDPPEILWISGTLPSIEGKKLLTVVGSRSYTSYGKQACEHLVRSLARYPVVIVSGLALGIDALAHKSALEADIPTIAVPGSGLGSKVLYPRSNHSLAKTIVERGGALVSEYEPSQEASPWTFPKRNRLMAGMSHATLVIEASRKSGTLITARLATEYNRDVLAVPGSIFNERSEGPNFLLHSGAVPITNTGDLHAALGFTAKETVRPELTESEEAVYELLAQPLPRDELLAQLNMSAAEANMLLSAMEIKGLIAELLGEVRRI